MNELRPKLKRTDHPSCRDEFSLEQLPITIGRGDDASVCVHDRWVSRRHCEVDAIDGALVVRDLGSKHGTFVNGEIVTQAVLKPGDQLGVGLSTFVAVYDQVADDVQAV